MARGRGRGFCGDNGLPRKSMAAWRLSRLVASPSEYLGTAHCDGVCEMGGSAWRSHGGSEPGDACDTYDKTSMAPHCESLCLSEEAMLRS